MAIEERLFPVKGPFGVERIQGVQSTNDRDARGRRKPVVFIENGWNIPIFPDYNHTGFLDTLDERCALIGLSKNGLNALEREPRDLDGYAALTDAFLERYHRGSGINILGHSMGFGVAYGLATRRPVQSLVGVAPILPGSHGRLRFLGRALQMGAGMQLGGTTGPQGARYAWRTAPGYTGRMLKDPSATWDIVGALARFRFDGQVRSPTLIVRPGVDELVPYSEDTRHRTERSGIFSHLETEVMRGEYDRHSLPLLQGVRTAERIIDFYIRNGIVGK